MFSELIGEGRCFGQNEVKKFLAGKISMTVTLHLIFPVFGMFCSFRESVIRCEVTGTRSVTGCL